MADVPELPKDPGATFQRGTRTPSPALDRVLATRWVIGQTAMPTETMPVAGAVALPEGPSYRLISQVGRGGMGEVWEAEQTSLRRIVAVKRLRADKLEDRLGLARVFHEEALTSARLDHPNIVPVYDLGRDDAGDPLLAMKLVRGTPWNLLIREDIASMEPEAYIAKHIPILVSVTQAVAFAHMRGIVHRDLKPSQVVVGSYGEVYLTDWGLAISYDTARLMESGGGPEALDIPTPINASSPAGTVAYMAPEQAALSAINVGPWTDVFLLGATLYHVLTGRPPRMGKPTELLWADALLGEYTPLAEAADGRDVPEDLARLVERAMASDFTQRNMGPEDFLHALQESLSGAGRRRESEALAADAARRLDAAERYGDYGEAMATATRALVLWPGNEDAERVVRGAAERLSRAALRNGDLVLARTEAARLGPTVARRELDSEIALAERSARSRERMRRIALGTAAALAAVVIGGGALFARALSAERDLAQANGRLAEQRAAEAERERAVAEAQLENSIGLSEFMLEDLSRSLDLRIGRDREIAEKILGTVKEQAKAIAGEELQPSGREKLARFLAEVAKHLADLGQPAESAAMLARARELIAGLEGTFAELTLLEAETTAFIRAGDAAEALTRAEQLLAVCREREDMECAGAALTQRGLAQTTLGRLDEAVASFREAIGNLEAIHGKGTAHIAVALVNLGGALERRGEDQAALEAFEQALPALAGEDGDVTLFASTLNNLTLLRERMGLSDPDDPALANLVELANRRLGPSHPHTAYIRTNVATMLGKRGRPDEAFAIFDEVLASLQASGLGDSRAAARVRTAKAATLNRVGRNEEGLAQAESARAYLEKTAPDTEELAQALDIQADSLQALGRNAEAAAIMREVHGWRARNVGPISQVTLETLLELAAVLDHAGSPAEAADALAPTLAELDAHPAAQPALRGEALTTMALVTFRAGKAEEAEDYFRTALSVLGEPPLRGTEDHLKALQNYAAFLAIQNRADESAAVGMERYAVTRPGPDASLQELEEWHFNGVESGRDLLDDVKLGKDAREAFDAAIGAARAHPESANLAVMASMAHYYLDRRDEARAALAEAQRLGPDGNFAKFAALLAERLAEAPAGS